MYYYTCIGPGMKDKTLSMFSELTSTSFTATRTSPEIGSKSKILKSTIQAPHEIAALKT